MENQLIEQILATLKEMQAEQVEQRGLHSNYMDRIEMVEEASTVRDGKIDELIASNRAILNQLSVVAQELLAIKGQFVEVNRRLDALEAA